MQYIITFPFDSSTIGCALKIEPGHPIIPGIPAARKGIPPEVIVTVVDDNNLFVARRDVYANSPMTEKDEANPNFGEIV